MNEQKNESDKPGFLGEFIEFSKKKGADER